MDLIDRQAAIDALCNNCDNPQAVCPHYPCKQYTSIEALPSANQWIHCSEKMPDKFGMYWVCTKGGYQVQAELTVNMGGHVEEPLVVWNLPFGYPKTEVVAWMPLPEPWKGEDNA